MKEEIETLRLVTAIDAALLRAVLRNIPTKDLQNIDKSFQMDAEHITVKLLSSSGTSDETIQAAQNRRDFWTCEIAKSDSIQTTASP